MEPRRMPFPATRYPLPHVGTPGRQGPRRDPCLNPQVYRLLRRGQSSPWQIHSLNIPHIRCSYLRGIPENIVAASRAQQTDGRDTRQCPLPPRQTAQAAAAKASSAPRIAVSTAVQSATGSHRAGLEVGASIGHAQPVLCPPGGCEKRHRLMLRPVAKTQFSAAKIMRHYLRRYV